KQHLGGGGHQGAAGDSKGQPPLDRGVHERAGDAHLVVVHLHVLVLHHQQAQGVKVGQPPVVDVFAQVIVAVIVHVHVHVHMEGAGLGLLQDVAHAAQDAVAPPVVIVAVKTVQPGKKGGHRPAGGAGRAVGGQIQQLRHPHLQGGGDVVEGGQVHGDLAVFVF